MLFLLYCHQIKIEFNLKWVIKAYWDPCMYTIDWALVHKLIISCPSVICVVGEMSLWIEKSSACAFVHVCLLIMFISKQRLAPWSRTAGRQGLPWSLSVIQSGVALLAIIFPVRSLAVSPPHHISLCQFPTCLWIEPRSMKLHATLIISFTATSRFQLQTQMSPLILRLLLIKSFDLFNEWNSYVDILSATI